MVYDIQQSMVVVLFVLTSAVLYKHAMTKDKGGRGWSWLIAGALTLFVDTSLRLINWPIIGLDGIIQWTSFSVSLVAAILMLIGTIKLLIEQFE
jgi:hypothetical protein